MTDASDFSAGTDAGLFAALLATAVDGIIVTDRGGRVLVYSKACENLFGYPAAEIVGQNVNRLMPEPYRAAHDGYLSHYRRTGERRIIGIGREVLGLRKDGKTFPMYLSVGEGGAQDAAFFVGIIRDLTDIKRELEEYAGADRLLAGIVQSSDDAIISKTLEGTITSWNPAAERIFGHTAEQAIGRNIAILFPPDRLAEEEEIVRRLKANQSVEHFETVRLHKNGHEILVSISVSPIHDGQGRIVGASKTARDITDRTRTQEELRSIQNELFHVGRLSAMGQMSAAIAHELNQPLAAVANYAKAAQRTLQAEDVTPARLSFAVDAMEKVAAQAIRAGTIIRYLRDFVEKRETERTLQDLNEVVREAVTLGTMGHVRSRVQVMWELAPQLPQIAIDKIQIQQVAINLVNNAIEAMAQAETRQLKISSWQEGELLCLAISDSGPGVSSEVAERLFEPFVTTKANGMGIGLRICQSIVEAHGGTITVASGSAGATFNIKLPLQ
ncbi:MAG: PAS domain-containing sensor histidine kinase [Rhizomicrobium sp.]